MSFKLLCWLLEISEMINMLTDIHLRAFPVFVSWKSPLNILTHSECFVGSVNNWSTEAAINASPEVDIGSGRWAGALRLSKVIQGMLIAGLMTSLEPYKGCVARLGCRPLWAEIRGSQQAQRSRPLPPRLLCGPGIQDNAATLENMLFCHPQPESYHQHSASYIR